MIRWRREKEKVAFALSGGGARGAVQVGMLRALLEQGIRPDFIVGVSIGSWNGAWVAQHPDVDHIGGLELAWRGVTRQTLQLAWWRVARNLARRRPYLYDGNGLSRFVSRHLSFSTFEDLPIPLYAVAIDVTLGKKAVISSGPLAQGLLASSAIPGIFPSILIDGHQHVDGGMVDPSGLQTAIELGARRVYVLNSGYVGRLESPLPSMNAVVDHTMQVAAQHLIESQIVHAGTLDVIHLRPSLGFLKNTMDFALTEDYVKEGYRYTLELLNSRKRGKVVQLRSSRPEQLVSAASGRS